MEHQDQDGRRQLEELLLSEPEPQRRRDLIAQMGAEMVVVS